jgi:hypothetical protein
MSYTKKNIEKKLEKLKGKVSTKDIKDAISMDIASQATISRYLNGNAPNVDTATELIKFFNSRIKKRAKIISNELC